MYRRVRNEWTWWLVALAVAGVFALLAAIAGGCHAAPDLSGVLPVVDKLGVATCVVVRQDPEWTYAATCGHCVVDNVPFTVDGRPGTVVLRDRGSDLAMLRFASEETYRVHRIAKAREHEPVMAVGWVRHFRITGWSPTRRWVQRGHVSWVSDTAVGTSCPLIMGFSGGPVLNRRGEIVGLCQRIVYFPRAGLFESFSLAVGSRLVQRMLDRLLLEGAER